MKKKAKKKTAMKKSEPPNPRISNGLSYTMFGLYRLTWRPSDGKCEVWYGSWKMGYRPIARGTVWNDVIKVEVTPQCMPAHHIPRIIMRILMEQYATVKAFTGQTDIGPCPAEASPKV